MAPGLWVVLCLMVLGVESARGESKAEGEDQLQNAVQTVVTLCQGHVTAGCLQLELLSQLERLTAAPDLQILPEVFLSRNASSTDPSPPSVPTPLPRDLDAATRTISRLLMDRSLHQMRSWTLSVPVFSNNTLHQFRNALENYVFDKEIVTGRKKSYWKWMGTALVTAGFSILSALVSKALTLSLVALAMTLFRGSSGGYGFGAAPASAPAVAYRAPPPVLRSHVHSAELQYLDEQDDAQPLVYVNKRNWKQARSDHDYDNFNRHYYSRDETG